MLPLTVDEKNKKKIVEQLGKSLKDLKECVDLMKTWLQTQKHLPEEPTTNMIEFFLVNNKFSIENTKQKLDMYYTIKTRIPEIFDRINPKVARIQSGLDCQYTLPLPKLLNDKYRVVVMKSKKYRENFEPKVQIANLVNLIEVRIQEDFMLGDIILFDLENMTMSHIYKTTLMDAKIATTILEKVYSNRVKEVHVINYHPICDLLLKLAKTVIKPKIIKRIRFHDSMDSLSKHIPLDILPEDYGGKEKCLDDLEGLWKKKLMEYADRFDKLDTLRVDESLRSSPLKDTDNFGLQGTFRKLDID